MSPLTSEIFLLNRRKFLKAIGLAPVLLRASPLFGERVFLESAESDTTSGADFGFSDVRYTPHYPTRSPLADVLRLVPPGSDQYVTEKYAAEIGTALLQFSDCLRKPIPDVSALEQWLDPELIGCQLIGAKETPVRSGFGIDVARRVFPLVAVSGRKGFLKEMLGWVGSFARIETAEFEIVGLGTVVESPLTVRVEIRYDLVGVRRGSSEERREEWVGLWRTEWALNEAAAWTARRWEAEGETVSSLAGPGFVDVTKQALGREASYGKQLLRGADHWRTVLDGACGIDVYGNNGVAAGDFDGDGWDDLYVCQAAGLPNRLYRNRGDGTFEDVTEKAGVGVLDGTACALFVDFENSGRQDLLVVCGTGPLLFLNQGDGTFKIKRDAFHFAKPVQGTFAHAAIADYDGDGRLDVYFCLYSYYLGLDQYNYPVPYFDARNGPANYLMHNDGQWNFSDRTEASGLNKDNDRYSFSCAWGESGTSGAPDLYVANDFGRSNLYRNNGNGTFTVVSGEAHVEDPGAGMSASWSDYENNGRQSIYAANMWSAAGQRVSQQKLFHENAADEIRALYHRHARGNSLYRNRNDETFENVSTKAGVEMGRWSWCSDFWDFDHDGYPDLYVSNGYVSATAQRNQGDEVDLGSFFWRQVVGQSPNDATPSLAYEHGWNALNELIRSDRSWNGYERNVLFANNRDGTFSEVSGALGMDFVEDGRSFALADLDGDGRLEVILKNRNAPQLRILHNAMKGIGGSIAFRLRGTKSNRDAIGAAVTVEAGPLKQTRYLQAGSGFLAQHAKELHFGLGDWKGVVRATVRWPSGLTQNLEGLPAESRIEVEEGSNRFTARPFGGTAATYGHPATPAPVESLPTQVGTWLIEPLTAPGSSLPDLAGATHDLQSLRGSPVLMTFWSASAPSSVEILRTLQQRRTQLEGARLEILAVNVDQAGELPKSRAIAAQEKFYFPLLQATGEVAGIYNIIYRYLFDRRRDLGLPTSFLLDREGRIVKVYQGPIDAHALLDDLRSIPQTAAERMLKAIPMNGDLYQRAFVRDDFTYGVALFQHGYLEPAAESFKQVIAAKPNDPEGYYNLGTLNLRRSNFDEARQYLEKSLELRPNYPEAWNNLGMMAAQGGKANEAIRNFEKSLQLRPGYAIALLNLGNVYRRQKEFDKAQDCLSRALKLQPDDPEIHYSLGMLFAQQGQVQQAADSLTRALELRPGYPEAMNNLGVLYVRTQELSKAEEQFRKCIELEPGFDQSYLNLARLYVMQGDREKARRAVQDLLTIQPDNANARQAMEMLQ